MLPASSVTPAAVPGAEGAAPPAPVAANPWSGISLENGDPRTLVATLAAERPAGWEGRLLALASRDGFAVDPELKTYSSGTEAADP